MSLCKLGPGRFQNLVEGLHQQIGVELREGQWRLDLEHVFEWAVGAQENPSVLHVFDDVPGERGGGLLGFAIGDKLDAQEQTHPAHIADRVVILFEAFESGLQPIADGERVFLQSLVLDDVQHRQADGARHGIAAEGVEVFHAVVERLGDVWRRDDGAEWMAVPDGFAQRHDVGHDSLRFETPEMCSHAAESDLDLIRNAHATGFTHVSERVFEVSVR